MLISAVSIDHLQNHFLPGSMGITYNMHYYITPSTTEPDRTTVTQIACVDYRFSFYLKLEEKKLTDVSIIFSGRSTQWYENIYGSLLAHNLISLRNTFTNANAGRV